MSHENPTLAEKNYTKKHEQLTLSHDVRGNSTSTHKSNNNKRIDIGNSLYIGSFGRFSGTFLLTYDFFFELTTNMYLHHASCLSKKVY
jgi:hypothetical protein